MNERQGRDRPRGPGIVYSALAIVMLVVVGVVALSATQPPPPTIAEFAPQAVEQITDAPSEQGSDFGSGEGGGGGGEGAGRMAAALQTPPPVAVVRTRRCVGDPPRQIEDPQSPPCVPSWQGNNGGSTYKGVTGSTIRIAFAEDHGSDYAPEEGVLETFFNSRFEFYGRKIDLLRFEPTGDQYGDATQMHADAVVVDEELEAFGALSYGDRAGNERFFYDELARRGLISVAGRTGFADQEQWNRRSPHQWSYLPGPDLVSRNAAEWICKTLRGGTADHAQGAEHGKARVFGILTHRTPDDSRIDLKPVNDGLRSCGITPATTETVTDPGDATTFQQDYRTAVLRLQDAGVTTVICICRAAALVWSSQPAVSASYYPEWLAFTWKESDDEPAHLHRDPRHAQSTFGLTFWSKRSSLEEAPCQWAAAEADPSFRWRPHNRFGLVDSGFLNCYGLYSPMLLLASGIQLAGPNLTPTTFRDGLYRARFPNPGAGGPPHFQAKVTFGPGDHTMNDDAAVVWYNDQERSHQQDGNPRGAWCYIEEGRRWGAGTWPQRPLPLFTGTCHR